PTPPAQKSGLDDDGAAAGGHCRPGLPPTAAAAVVNARAGSPSYPCRRMGTFGGGDSLVTSVVELTRALVRIPSQSGVDSLEPIASAIADWLAGHGLHPEFVDDNDPGLG